MDFGRESRNQTLARQFILDHREADLEPADRALCDFAVKMTLDPGAMNAADVKRLREHGFSDAAITVATQVIGYFNYINRVADGLGVDEEPWMKPSRDEWLATKGRNYRADPT